MYSSQFEQDVIEGLRKKQKRISSKYFYDEKGDKIFQEIMAMEEYYLPESELEIIKTRTKEIGKSIDSDQINVIELGSGDGTKTVYFLKELITGGKDVNYYPMDISAEVLVENKTNVSKILPELAIRGIAGDYTYTMKQLPNDRPNVFLFMGSNIGNFEGESSTEFLKFVRGFMKSGDILLLAADLKKNPKTILLAYNDPKGITARFNYNLLHRINKELNGNIDVEQFEHYPFYDPRTGTVYSYLVSLSNQDVFINGHAVSFLKNELLHTEVSQKYSLEQIEAFKESVDFESVQHFLDKNDYYTLSMFVA